MDDLYGGLGEITPIHDQIGDLLAQRKERIADATTNLEEQERLCGVLGLVDLLHMIQLVEDNIEIVAVFEEAVSVVAVEIVPILACVVVELL